MGIEGAWSNQAIPASALTNAPVYVQASAPSGKIPLNSIWFNTTAGAIEYWNGTAWVVQAFNAQEIITPATILAAQVANGTLTTTQLAAAAGILGSQIASATITSGNIAANTIVAGNIAANTITAAQLAAGIIYAGIVNGTTIEGAELEGDGSGNEMMLYSGTPTANNLVASANASGSALSDGHGNESVGGPGLTVYGELSGTWYAFSLEFVATNGGPSIELFTATSEAGPWTDAGSLLFYEPSDGITTIGLSAGTIQTAGSTGTPSQVSPGQLSLAPSGVPSNPFSTDGLFYATTAGTPAAGTPAGLQGTLDITQSEISTNTNTSASYEKMTAQWTIPADDPKEGTVYRLTSWGSGTEGTTSDNLNWRGVIGSTGVANLEAVLSGVIGTSDNFDYVSVIELIITETGASGTCNVRNSFTVQAVAAATASNTLACVQVETGVTVNTTTANDFYMQSAWAATTGSPTVSGYNSILERLGP